MSDVECAHSDWTAIGYADGSRGYSGDRLSGYNKACARHGVTPDFSAYQSGRTEGLREFCRPSRGFQLGENGGRYNGVCAADLEPAFLEAYNIGSHLHGLRANVRTVTSRISSREKRLKSIDEDIRAAEVKLIAAETTTQERVLLLAELKDLSEQAGQIEVEIRDLYAERTRHEVELQNYQASLTSYAY